MEKIVKVILKFKEAFIKESQIIKDVTTIGRDVKNDIHVDNPAISSFHAKIIREGEDHYIIEDMNSTNGTYVNNKRISRVLLNDNDVISIGKHNLIYSNPHVQTEKTVKVKKALSEATIVIDPKKVMPSEKELPAAGAPAAERLGCMTIIEGSTDRKEYELNKRLTTIGKADTAEIKLKGFFAPKVAALINRTKDGYVISSAESGKKVKINGTTIEGRYDLKDGDLIEIAGIKMQFYYK